MGNGDANAKITGIAAEDYKTLADFRHALRRFLVFSEEAAKESGLTAQQHQAILAIKGHNSGAAVTIGDLAGHLLIRHNSAVELVDRLVRLHLVTRLEAPDDKRRVVIALTPKAETILETLSAMHLDELRRGRALLLQVLNRLDAPHSR